MPRIAAIALPLLLPLLSSSVRAHAVRAPAAPAPAALSSWVRAPAPPAPPPAAALLASAVAWIAALPGLSQNNVSANGRALATSIFINGNLARGLLAASRLPAGVPPAAAAAGLAWCDALAAAQQPITTSSGAAGGWWDTGYNDLYLADTGTAVVAAELCWQLAPPGARRDAWEAALRRYTDFVSDGCAAAPAAGHYGKDCPPPGTGWLLPDGSVGDGYVSRRLNNYSYTISTATTGSAFLPLWAALPLADHGRLPAPALEAAALAAVRWIVGNRSADGRIPYIITPPDRADHDLQCITYSAESFVVMARQSPAARDELQSLNSTAAWLLRTQNADGSWGNASDIGEVARSPRAVSLLQFYADAYRPANEPAMRTAIDNWLTWTAAGANGLFNNNTLFMGFAALALADLVQPGVTYPFV